MKKMNPLLPVALVLAVVSPQVLAKDVTVMISGGFKAALEKLAPQFEAASGDSIILVSGPSMGKNTSGHSRAAGARRTRRCGDHGGRGAG